jgi:hypothetical protein
VGPKITNTGILLFAAASLAFVLGFAYGNVLGLERVFDLEKWQTLVGTVVAVLAAAAAFLGVRGTQRINVILKEQERLDKLLPGWRQANDFLSRLSHYLDQISDRTRYMSITVIRDFIQFKGNETFAEMVDRRISLADDQTKREVTGVIVSLVKEATTLKLAKDEHTTARKKLTELHLYAEESKQSVREDAERAEVLLKQMNEQTDAEFRLVAQAASSMKARLEEAEERRKVIGIELEQFFRRD